MKYEVFMGYFDAQNSKLPDDKKYVIKYRQEIKAKSLSRAMSKAKAFLNGKNENYMGVLMVNQITKAKNSNYPLIFNAMDNDSKVTILDPLLSK